MAKNDKKAFYEELDRLLADQRVRNLNNFSQHNGTTFCMIITSMRSRKKGSLPTDTEPDIPQSPHRKRKRISV